MGEVRLDKFDNTWYNPGSTFKRVIWFYVNAIFLNSYLLPVNGIKIFILKMFGAKIGKGVVIKPKVNVKYPWKLEIGNHVWIGEKVWIDCLDTIKIHDHVCLSQGALLLAGSHDYRKSAFDLRIAPITLKKGSWICAQSSVLGGTTIEENTMIAIQSVAPRRTQPNVIYKGNPAVKVGDRIIKG